MIRRLIRERFVQFGFEVCAEAENGKDAIEKAAIMRPDLITLDLSMPVMNGLEAAPQLKAILPHTPIILFTQFGNAVRETQLRLAGIDALASKSDPVDSLIKKAQSLLGFTEAKITSNL